MKKLNAYAVYLIFHGSFSFIFSLIVTVNMVYQVTTVGLNPLQLVLVGTALELSAAIFEVPTGVVADTYGRRLSVIIGTALFGVGFIIEGAFPVWGMVLLGQVVWGFGWTFISGALDAWISDEIGTERAGQAFLRASQIAGVAGLVAILPSVLLGEMALQMPIVLGGVLFLVLAGFLLTFMPEDGFKPAPQAGRSSWGQMRATLGEGVKLVRLRPALVTLLLVELFFGAYSESFDRLWTPFLLEEITLPEVAALGMVGWFGVIRAAGSLLSIGATEVVKRRLDLTNTRDVSRAMLVFYSIVGAGTLVFVASRGPWMALAGYWVLNTARVTAMPVYMAWVNSMIDSEVRATVLSMTALANEVGQVAGGPAIGAIGTVASIRAALAAGGVLLLPAIGLLRRQARQVTAQGDSVPDAAVAAD